MKCDLIASHRVNLDEQCEIIWAQIEIVGSKSILVGAFYRPPESGSDVLDHLQSSLFYIDTSKNHSIWLGGDFNLSHMNWDTQSTLRNCPKPGLCRSLIDINEVSLDQVVRQPTRGNNILDLFFTSNSTLVEKTIIVPGMSDDHNGIPLITINTRLIVNNETRPRKVCTI